MGLVRSRFHRVREIRALFSLIAQSNLHQQRMSLGNWYFSSSKVIKGFSKCPFAKGLFCETTPIQFHLILNTIFSRCRVNMSTVCYNYLILYMMRWQKYNFSWRKLTTLAFKKKTNERAISKRRKHSWMYVPSCERIALLSRYIAIPLDSSPPLTLKGWNMSPILLVCTDCKWLFGP